MGGKSSKEGDSAEATQSEATRAEIPRYWRVTVEALPPSRRSAEPNTPPGPAPPALWLVVSRAGASVKPDAAGEPDAAAATAAGRAPCVYVVPENDSPEDAEKVDMMPRFKLMSADRSFLTGPHRAAREPGAPPVQYSGGAAAVTTNAADGRDFLEAYPAPVNKLFAPDRFDCYLWSPSRQAALSMDAGGRLVWDAKTPARTVTNFGMSRTVTVWTFRREWGTGA